MQELDYTEAIRCSPAFFIGILGSFNGIICSFVDYEKLVLLNSSTRDSKELTKPSLCLSYVSLLDLVMIPLLMIINLLLLAALLLMVLNKLWLKFLH